MFDRVIATDSLHIRLHHLVKNLECTARNQFRARAGNIFALVQQPDLAYFKTW
jgi:hypothetical protein